VKESVLNKTQQWNEEGKEGYKPTSETVNKPIAIKNHGPYPPYLDLAVYAPVPEMLLILGWERETHALQTRCRRRRKPSAWENL